jgi:DNA-binding LacI/PurR family transcriptional regulator
MSRTSDFTIADVARDAGVSVSTVSRILNGKQDVAPATRVRVQQVMEELDYSPHSRAQRLRAGKTRTLVLLYPPYPGIIPHNSLNREFYRRRRRGHWRKALLLQLPDGPDHQA